MAGHSGVQLLCFVRRQHQHLRPDNHASLDRRDAQQTGTAAGSHPVSTGAIPDGSHSPAAVAVYAGAVDG